MAQRYNIFLNQKKSIMDISNLTFDDYLKRATPSTSLANEVIVFDREQLTSKHILNPETMPPVRLDDTVVFILCKYGKASFSVNYETYHLSKGSSLVLSNKHIIDNIKVDNNCEALAVILSQNFVMSCVHDTPYIKKMMEAMNKQTVLIPFLQLKDDEMRDLTDMVMHIQKYLKKPDHAFQSQMVKNETSNLILEFANIYLQQLSAENQKDKKESRKDEIMRDFVKLISQNFKEQHEVAFYADKLGMTAVNLSRTVVAASGKSPIQWISGVLIIEAKTLLRKPDATIKRVADEQNFGDQSSFGKFFKKHTGMTPVEYKNGGQTNAGT
jgi:AraC-like DNA-binding protein